MFLFYRTNIIQLYHDSAQTTTEAQTLISLVNNLKTQYNAAMKTTKPIFPELIPPHYKTLFDIKNKKDPLYKMSVFSKKELKTAPYELLDPIADKAHGKAPNLIHRYKDRVLLMPTQACAIHCRFCFRKNLLTQQTNPTQPDLGKAFAYISRHKEIWEVILSGGDPLMLEPKKLREILIKLNRISHIKTIRIHTRLPVVAPNLLTQQKLTALKSSKKPLTIVLHINHPNEISKELIVKTKVLKPITNLLLSQSVLLKGVNDNTKTLKNLFTSLVEIGIKPYYLHQLDPAKGTSHFKVSLKRATTIYNSLRGQLSGICIPEFMIEQPNGKGKIPVNRLLKQTH